MKIASASSELSPAGGTENKGNSGVTRACDLNFGTAFSYEADFAPPSVCLAALRVRGVFLFFYSMFACAGWGACGIMAAKQRSQMQGRLTNSQASIMRRLPRARVAAWALSMVLSAAAAQQASPPAAPQISAQELVRRAIANEETPSHEKVRLLFRLRTETARNGVITKQMVETNDGVVARLIAVNGKPPSAEDRKRDDDRLQTLANDPQARAAKQKQQKEDEERTDRMVKALPDAFLYEYDGTEPGSHGALIRLKFKPNPKYDPPTRELQVYQGMQGAMLIDAANQRLVTIKAQLFRSVNFGWGILGRLDPGGQFEVSQSRVNGERWEVTEMRLRFTGKILLFKSLNINEHETASDYRRAPDNLTFVQGIEFLKSQPEFIAEQQNKER